MTIDWQVPVPMPDGAVLRADVYRPVGEGRFPVILSHGVYAKGLPLSGLGREGPASAVEEMTELKLVVIAPSST
jgi:hypothetical protein